MSFEEDQLKSLRFERPEHIPVSAGILPATTRSKGEIAAAQGCLQERRGQVIRHVDKDDGSGKNRARKRRHMKPRGPRDARRREYLDGPPV